MLDEACSFILDAESGIAIPLEVACSSPSARVGSVEAGKLICSRLSMGFIYERGLDAPSLLVWRCISSRIVRGVLTR
jgi:hypothetical protein